VDDLLDVQRILSGAGLQLTRVVDSHGRDIPPGAIPNEVANAVVIAQVPEPGAAVRTNGPIVVGVTAKAEFTERVKVPDVSGLTTDQARTKLAAAGLVMDFTFGKPRM
jgi:beta-lactam-binding protein with PASTA domain